MKYIDNPKEKYHVLARGVILSGNKLLVAHCIGEDNTFLPGGHVEFHEGTRSSLRREIDEELGLRCEVHGYLGAVEAAYQTYDIYHQEINHLFLVVLSDIDPSINPESKEKHLEFYWIPVADMDKHHLLPHPVRTIIINYVEHQEQGPHWLSTLDEA
ncbi:NUDIX domain-containing protein [Paenibacillus macerans]|uniref:NUDIX domain-containing protein n=1 Tax=Paenibacillus macerans TaxID=44252 RepID=UPI003D31E742